MEVSDHIQPPDCFTSGREYRYSWKKIAGWVLGTGLLEMGTFLKCEYLREWRTMDEFALFFLGGF
jgi:hypothetical protein